MYVNPTWLSDIKVYTTSMKTVVFNNFFLVLYNHDVVNFYNECIPMIPDKKNLG